MTASTGQRPQQQDVLSIEPLLSIKRERLTLGCGCTIERASRGKRPARAVCPVHDKRVDV